MAGKYYDKEIIGTTNACSTYGVMICSYWDILQSVSGELPNQIHTFYLFLCLLPCLSFLCMAMKGTLSILFPPQYALFWRFPMHCSQGCAFQNFFCQNWSFAEQTRTSLEISAASEQNVRLWMQSYLACIACPRYCKSISDSNNNS